MERGSINNYPAALRLGSGILAAGMMLGPLTGCASEDTAIAQTISASAEVIPTIDISKQYIAQIIEPFSGQEQIGEKSLENITNAYN